MAAPSLFDAPIDNHALFADHYLKTPVPQHDDVQPILKEVLDWARKVQPQVQRQEQVGRPDYALFTTDARRSTAVEHAGGDETKVFDYADAVAEAKYWGRPASRPSVLGSSPTGLGRCSSCGREINIPGSKRLVERRRLRCH